MIAKWQKYEKYAFHGNCWENICEEIICDTSDVVNIIETPLQQHEERGVKIAPNLWCKVNLVEVSVFSTLLLEKLSTLNETDLKENHKGEGS